MKNSPGDHLKPQKNAPNDLTPLDLTGLTPPVKLQYHL